MTKNEKALSEIEKRYQRSQQLMQGYFVRTIVANSTVYPTWIPGENCFWYQRDINIEKNTIDLDQPFKQWDKEYRLVNAKTKSNILAFDHQLLASALADAIGSPVDCDQLPINELELSLDATQTVSRLKFLAFEKHWQYDVPTNSLTVLSVSAQIKDHCISPDSQWAIFTRDYNLWLIDLKTNKERALTTDGEEQYCYGAGGNGWGFDLSTGLQAIWSPDCKYIYTVQRDCRKVVPMPVVEHVPSDGSIRPKVDYFPLALPGDEHIPEYRLVVIDISTGDQQDISHANVPVSRNSWGFFDSGLGWWGNDSAHVYYVDLARDYKNVRVVEFDVTTGVSRLILEETSNTHINLMVNADEYPTILPLPDSNELIWFSERSGWAHLYLYDLTIGNLKNPITQGDWVVRNILYYDQQRRELFLHTMGRTPRKDPYYRDVVRVNIDTGELVELVSSDDDYYSISRHQFDLESITVNAFCNNVLKSVGGVSPEGDFILSTRSRVDRNPVSVLLDRDGCELLTVETGDMSALYARVSRSWQWPEPVKILAADNSTDLYGVLYRPSDFSPDKSYPVISYGFNTPELPRVPKGSFSNGATCGRYYLEASALAELGFIVVQIDARGTPFRSKAFQDSSYGWVESAGCIDDHVVGIKQLAERYPYMDIDRVGICSLGGGTGAVQGLLQHPDFFKVGVNGGLHDSRLMAASMWGNKYEGITGPDIKHQYPETYADRLEGKLMLFHGLMDICTLPANTFRLIDALQKANKDADLVLMPSLGHAHSSYLARRAWDYFVRHLLGVEPPKGFYLQTAEDL